VRRLAEVGTPKLELRQFCGTCRSPVRDIYRSCGGVQSTQLRTNANDLLHKSLAGWAYPGTNPRVTAEGIERTSLLGSR
jgi:hypothetical protein